MSRDMAHMTVDEWRDAARHIRILLDRIGNCEPLWAALLKSLHMKFIDMPTESNQEELLDVCRDRLGEGAAYYRILAESATYRQDEIVKSAGRVYECKHDSRDEAVLGERLLQHIRS